MQFIRNFLPVSFIAEALPQTGPVLRYSISDPCQVSEHDSLVNLRNLQTGDFHPGTPFLKREINPKLGAEVKVISNLMSLSCSYN